MRYCLLFVYSFFTCFCILLLPAKLRRRRVFGMPVQVLGRNTEKMNDSYELGRSGPFYALLSDRLGRTIDHIFKHAPQRFFTSMEAAGCIYAAVEPEDNIILVAALSSGLPATGFKGVLEPAHLHLLLQAQEIFRSPIRGDGKGSTRNRGAVQTLDSETSPAAVDLVVRTVLLEKAGSALALVRVLIDVYGVPFAGAAVKREAAAVEALLDFSDRCKTSRHFSALIERITNWGRAANMDFAASYRKVFSVRLNKSPIQGAACKAMSSRGREDEEKSSGALEKDDSLAALSTLYHLCLRAGFFTSQAEALGARPSRETAEKEKSGQEAPGFLVSAYESDEALLEKLLFAAAGCHQEIQVERLAEGCGAVPLMRASYGISEKIAIYDRAFILNTLRQESYTPSFYWQLEKRRMRRQ